MKLATLTRIGGTRRVEPEHSLPLADTLRDQLQNAQPKEWRQVRPPARTERRQQAARRSIGTTVTTSRADHTAAASRSTMSDGHVV